MKIPLFISCQSTPEWSAFFGLFQLLNITPSVKFIIA